MTKRRVLLDGNGSTQIHVEGLGVYVPAAELSSVKRTYNQERDALAAQVEELKTFIKKHALPNLLVASDDYPQCLGIRSAITDAEELVNSNSGRCLTDILAKAMRKFVIDTNETGQLSFPDCQWLEAWCDEWLEEAAKGGE